MQNTIAQRQQVYQVHTSLKSHNCKRFSLHLAFSLEQKTLLLPLCQRLKAYIETVEPEIVQLAKQHGFEVLYTPPYHCDLQPIEMVWSQVKDEVGRQYDIATTMQIVKQRLEAAFENLNADTMGENREPVHPCQKDRTRIHGG